MGRPVVGRKGLSACLVPEWRLWVWFFMDGCGSFAHFFVYLPKFPIAEASSEAVGCMGAVYMERRLLGRFVLLTALNLASSRKSGRRQGNGRCPVGCVLCHLVPCPWLALWKGGGIGISAWASALLVRTGLGNARALSSGTCNWYRLPRHFFVMPDFLIVFCVSPGRGVCRGAWLARCRRARGTR